MKRFAMGIVVGLGLVACSSQVPLGNGTGVSQAALGGPGEPPRSDGSCDARLTACANVCVDPMGDKQNCGGCGVSCGAQDSCSAGQCVPPSPGEDAGSAGDGAGPLPGRDAGPTSVDAGPGTGLPHGGLGEPPRSDGSCDARLTACANVCVDPMGDPQNCGGCGVVCGAQDSCDAGQCVPPLPPIDAAPPSDAGPPPGRDAA